MTINARLYVTVFLALGLCVLGAAFGEWRPSDLPRFISYLGFSAAASVIRVAMPGLAGSMAFNFLLAMIAIADLSLPETLLIGLAGTLIECVWRRQSLLSPIQVFFHLATTSVAISSTYSIFHWGYLSELGTSPLARHALAGTIFFISNSFPQSAVVSLIQHAPLLRTWWKAHFWSYPYYLIGAGLAWLFHEVEPLVGWQTALLLIPLAYLIYRTYCLYVARLEDARVHAEEFANLHLRTIEALALAIEAKDNTTSDHLRRVQVYAMELGSMLGLSKGELEALRAAALLHDIGKLAVPEHIISKPGKLTPEEFEKMKIHPIVGAEILEHVQFPYPVVPIVRSHHEKWNGTGYPHGLRGEDIPIGARILSAVDALDALASDRQYRRALPLEEAMAKVEIEAGRSFDPKVIDLLKRHHVRLEKKAKEEADSAGAVRLSTDMKIERGAAPASGFELTRPGLPPKSPEERPSLLEAVAEVRVQLQTLFDTPVTGAPDLDELLAVFSVRLKRAIEFEALALYLVREDKLVPEYVSGDNYRLFSSLRIPMGQGLSGWVAENRRPIVNGNPTVEPGYLNDPNIFSTLRSALAVPLEGSRDILGVLTLYHEGRDAFTKDDQRLLQAIAPKLAVCIERSSKSPKAGDRTLSDPVSGLPNWRSLFPRLEEEIARCGRLNAGLAVLVCHVEGLTELQRQFGRAEANRVVTALAIHLRESCGEYDFIARTGADEFTMILPGLRKEAARARAERIMRIGPLPNGHAVKTWVGAAYYPDDSSVPEQLMAAADRRLFDVQLCPEALEPAVSVQAWVQ